MNQRSLADFLEEMARRKREEVRARIGNRSLASMEKLVADRDPPPDFAAALAMPSGGRIRLIAEMNLARRVVQAGASAVSVLTEEEFFQGSLQDLSRVAAGVPAPVMRKDFIVDTYQLLEARVAGAAACLLIAAMLSRDALQRLMKDAADLGMAALVETHDRGELEDALEADAAIIGINNRNLKTLQVDRRTTFELMKHVPEGKIIVCESGQRSRADLAELEEAGVHAVLIGEAIMRSEDVGLKVRELLGGNGPSAGLGPSTGG